MPKKKAKPAKSQPSELRGVIDQIEGDVVVVAFDDEQRLDWPRRFVPEDAKSGDAVSVRLMPADDDHWSGESEGGQIALDKQMLHWPGKIEDGPMALSIAVDAADTTVRKERVRGLIDDIFKKKS